MRKTLCMKGAWVCTSLTGLGVVEELAMQGGKEESVVPDQECQTGGSNIAQPGRAEIVVLSVFLFAVRFLRLHIHL